jgi:hypothetical protein
MQQLVIFWDDVVTGVYVHHGTHGWLKAIEHHPQDGNRWRMVDGRGDIHDLQLDPKRRVKAYVPSPEEAAQALLEVFHADQRAEQLVVEPLPPRSPHRWRGHLRIYHGIYTEPSLPLAELRAAHASAHAQRRLPFPHVHRSVP